MGVAAGSGCCPTSSFGGSMARLDVGKSVVPRSVVTSCSSSPASPTGPQRSQHVMALCLAYSRAVPRHACPLARDSNADPSTDPLDHSIFLSSLPPRLSRLLARRFPSRLPSPASAMAGTALVAGFSAFIHAPSRLLSLPL
eukprot:CAMPEP_0197439706 /NCGR_PEP_ID=MMETSP1175-20131217/6383_1 /TAXON_ID=1003142 /ORGANISM="Triceratium dubium, Strain CCMP147" /LENGTH=140 /DNA_ID=CAMNT_0042969665 /DNA_START=205 /DNA_END=627 /DNA_ORIENTATION=-